MNNLGIIYHQYCSSSDDALNYLDAFCGEGRAVGFLMGELGGLAIDNFFGACVERVGAW
jgi:hypothetical protein